MNHNLNILYDISGNGHHATTNGTIVQRPSMGDGAKVIVQSIKGGPSSTGLWPNGSIPVVFTICSVTKYLVGGENSYILKGLSSNWYHGHHSGKRGVARYGNVNPITPEVEQSIGVLTDWLVICGKNTGSIPYNVLVDGVPVGSSAGGDGTDVLSINMVNGIGDWGFKELMIWTSALSDADVVEVSTALQNSLLYDQVFNLRLTLN